MRQGFLPQIAELWARSWKVHTVTSECAWRLDSGSDCMTRLSVVRYVYLLLATLTSVKSSENCEKCTVAVDNFTSALETAIYSLYGRNDTSTLPGRGGSNELRRSLETSATGVPRETGKLLSNLETTLDQVKDAVESMAVTFKTACAKCNATQELLLDQIKLYDKIRTDRGPLLRHWMHYNLTTTETAMANSTLRATANNTLDTLNSTYSSSCQDVLNSVPDSASGFYALYDVVEGKFSKHYCRFQELCNSSGPWRRVAYLNMSDSEQNCPSQLKEYHKNGVRACGRRTTRKGSCQSVRIPATFPYLKICGRVIGYQMGLTHGFWAGKTIDEHYVDGVSLTYGFPRKHLWSFAAQTSDGYYSFPICECQGDSRPSLEFVDKNFFCESGSHWLPTSPQLHATDPLWDGQGCGPIETECCHLPGIPWFHKILATPTASDMELRVCGNLGTKIGNVPVGLYEIYVQEP